MDEMNPWMNGHEWTKDIAKMNVWNEWMSGWVNEWLDEWMTKWMNEWMNQRGETSFWFFWRVREIDPPFFAEASCQVEAIQGQNEANILTLPMLKGNQGATFLAIFTILRL